MSTTQAPRSVILLDGSAVVVHGDADEVHIPAIAVECLRKRFIREAATAERERAERLDGERLYRVWWHEMWRQGSNPLQWEQLPDGKKDGWNRIAAALTRGPSDE